MDHSAKTTHLSVTENSVSPVDCGVWSSRRCNELARDGMSSLSVKPESRKGDEGQNQAGWTQSHVEPMSSLPGAQVVDRARAPLVRTKRIEVEARTR